MKKARIVSAAFFAICVTISIVCRYMFRKDIAGVNTWSMYFAYFYVLIPFVSLVIGIYAGAISGSKLKYLTILLCGAWEVATLAFCSYENIVSAVRFFIHMAPFAMIPAVFGVAAGSMVRERKEKHDEKRTENQDKNRGE